MTESFKCQVAAFLVFWLCILTIGTLLDAAAGPRWTSHNPCFSDPDMGSDCPPGSPLEHMVVWSYHTIDYTGVRWNVFLVSLFAGIVLLSCRAPYTSTIFFTAALLFNPIDPFRFGRDTWVMIDYATVGSYVTGLLLGFYESCKQCSKFG